MSAKLMPPTLIASVFTVVLSWGFPAMGAGDITFGDVPSFQENNSAYAPSPDKKAVTITFSGLELGSKLNTPIITRVYSIVLPISGGEKGVEIPFHFQGYSLNADGADSYAVFSVNGQTSTVNFPPGHDDSYLHTLVYKAASASEARLTIFLVVETDAKHPSGNGYLNVQSIDTQTTPVAAPKKPRQLQ